MPARISFSRCQPCHNPGGIQSYTGDAADALVRAGLDQGRKMKRYSLITIDWVQMVTPAEVGVHLGR